MQALSRCHICCSLLFIAKKLSCFFFSFFLTFVVPLIRTLVFLFFKGPRRSCSATTGNLYPQQSAFLCGDRRNGQLLRLDGEVQASARQQKQSPH